MEKVLEKFIEKKIIEENNSLLHDTLGMLSINSSIDASSRSGSAIHQRIVDTWRLNWSFVREREKGEEEETKKIDEQAKKTCDFINTFFTIFIKAMNGDESTLLISEKEKNELLESIKEFIRKKTTENKTN